MDENYLERLTAKEREVVELTMRTLRRAARSRKLPLNGSDPMWTVENAAAKLVFISRQRT